LISACNTIMTNNYAFQLVSKVVSSVPLPGTNLNLEGKEVFEVTCEDTILFPEGGGQVDVKWTRD